MVTNEGRGSYAGRRFESLGIEFSYARFAFEDLVRYAHAPDRGPIPHRENIRRAVEELDEVDGVIAEAPEAILLAYVRHKRGMRPIRWLVNVVQRLRRAAPVRQAIVEWYGDDPLPILTGDPLVHWVCTTSTHTAELVQAGLPRERLVQLPVSSLVHDDLFPDSAAALRLGRALPLPAPLASVAGEVLLAGTNNRDIATTARAAELLGRPIHVLTDLSRNVRVESDSLVYHDVVPLEQFVAAVAHAGVLVIPVVPGEDSCGQATVAIAQRVGTLIVGSDVAALRDYVEHEVTGFLAPPGDAAALAACLERALALSADSRMVEAAHARDARDGVLFREMIHRVFIDETATARRA